MDGDWFDPVKGIRPYGKRRYIPYKDLKGAVTRVISAEAFAVSRVCVYVRVSTDEQGRKGLSLAAQVLSARECVERLGLPPIGILICDQDSASTFAHCPRPGWEKLKQMAECGEFTTLLVLSLDRLSRKGPREVIPFVYQLLDKKIDLIWTSPTHKTPVGNELIDLLLLSIKAEEARQLSSTISEKVTGSIRAAYLSGLPQKGVIPYGYKVLDGSVVPNEAHATVVRTAFQLALDPAMSLKQIAAEVSKSDPDGKRWTPNRVRRLLENPMVAGFRSAPPSVRKDPDVSPLVALQNWQPLVSRETWDVVQAVLAANPARECAVAVADTAERTEKRAPSHLLAGLGRCLGCKSPLTVRMGKKPDESATYICSRAKSGTCHQSGTIPVEQVVEAVLRLLNDRLVTKSASAIADDWVQASAARSTRLKRFVTKLSEQLNRLDALQNNLADIITQIPAADWPMKATLHAKIREVTHERECVLSRLEPANARLSAYTLAMQIDVAWVRRQKRLAGKLLRASPNEQQPLLHQIAHAVSADLNRRIVGLKLRAAPFSPGVPEPADAVWLRAAVNAPEQAETLRRSHPDHGALPFGYGNRNGELVVIPEEAEIVRFVFQEAASVSRRAVAAALARHANSLTLGPNPWDHNRVTCMVRNPRYCGKEVPNRDGRVCRLSRCLNGAFPPIVSHDEWLAAQSRRKPSRRGKRR